ncbi:MAG: magnesium transporter [Blastocatellia bacterium]|jgi:magnesium transporter|nr:magnesium transporter [Blastocatellia bacterium]
MPIFRQRDEETTLIAGTPPIVSTVISSQPLETAIRAYVDRDDRRGLRSFLATHSAPDIADVIDRLPEALGDHVFDMLQPPAAAAVLSEVGVAVANRILNRLTSDRAAILLGHLPADDVADVIEDMKPGGGEALLSAMDPEAAADVRTLLRYPESSAGRLMTERFVRIPGDMTAGHVLDHLRAVDPDVETVSDLYVTDDAGTLLGVVSLRQVLVSPPDRRVGEFMTTNVVSAAPTDDQEVVARLVAHYNFMALPIVDEGRILGIVTVDDVLDVLVEEGTEDQLKFGGVEPGVLDQPYFTTSIWRVVRSRVGWLLLLFVAETATGSVLRHFEDELARVVALSFFIPLLIGTGGNTGAQTVSTIIRGIAIREIRLRDTGRVLVREVASGALLGLLLGAVGFFRAEMWGTGVELSIVVGLTLLAVVLWANTVGALIPLVAHRFRVDPALVSAPLITTLVDASGLVIYLLIAKAMLSALQ